MIHVFLDDLRPCPKGFVLARTAEECVTLLLDCDVGVLSLDYELGPDSANGMAVVESMIVHRRFPREVYVHSSSPMGKAWMLKALRDAAPPDTAIHDGPVPETVRRAIAEGKWQAGSSERREEQA